MRAIVTGASGFVGRHLTRELARSMEVVEHRGDVRDAASYAGLGRADVLLHLAARSSVAESHRDPVGTWDVNATGTLRLLEWARGAGVGRVVLVSTAHVYGKARRSPIDEEHPRHPASPYGASKLAAEGLLESYQASYGIEGVIVRPFNIYGPGQARGFLVPDVLHQIREGRDLAVGDTSPVRDFLYIGDAVDLLVKAATSPRAAGAILNLGSGEGHSIGAVIETALRVAGSPLQPRVDPARFRPAEIPELVVDNRRARELLGWRPTVTLEEGLRRTWAALAEART
ncbi:MAG TPA: GDP-mannose 4,6-dehydratase [Candidatus Thermoplasmatota archaeon]|nr:GDP-mannose 4,6-dehydratase [Candidatus Thermoplasmatota archaeon]